MIAFAIVANLPCLAYSLALVWVYCGFLQPFFLQGFRQSVYGANEKFHTNFTIALSSSTGHESTEHSMPEQIM